MTTSVQGSNLNFIDLSHIYRSIAAWWTFGSRSVGYAVTASCIEAEELSANSFIFEACRCATVATTLRIQGKQCAGQWTSQSIILMRCIVQTAGCVAAINSNKERNCSEFWRKKNGSGRENSIRGLTLRNGGNFESCTATIGNLFLCDANLT